MIEHPIFMATMGLCASVFAASTLEGRVEIIDAYAKSEGVQINWGLDLIRELLKNENNLVVEANQCELKGFYDDTRSEYKARSVLRSEAGGSISLIAPQAGQYYLAFVIYDSSGAEKVGIYIDGDLKGVAVADVENNRNHVFTLAEPYTFKGGEEVVLQTGKSQGAYRIEKNLFLKEKPPVQEREHTIIEVHAEPIIPQNSDETVRASITWISSWPGETCVEYGRTMEYGNKVIEYEGLALNNHRIILEQLERDTTYHYRVVAGKPDGGVVYSPDYSFKTAEREVRSDKAPSLAKILLKVDNPTEHAWQGWPVTSGIPFPQGDLISIENIRILNAQGSEIPSQIGELGRWQDESIKWALVDFQADVDANAVAQYTLEYGTKIRRKSFETPTVKTAISENYVEVVTGPLKFVIDKNRFGLLDNVWLDVNSNGEFQDNERITQNDSGESGIHLLGVDGTVYTSLNAPDVVEVEENGPMRAVVRVEGTHKDSDGNSLFAYIVRIHAYAGKSYLRVFHTFGNNKLEQEFTSIKSLTLKVPLNVDVSDTIRLSQNFDDQYTLCKNGKVTDSGRCSEGWVGASDGRWGVIAAVRNFWQLYPKSLTANESGLEIGICPPIGNEYEGHDPQTQDKLYYYLLNGEYKFKRGVSKRHELFFYFHKGDAETANGESLAKAFQEPLLATAEPDWYCNSKVFGDLMSAEQSVFSEYDEVMHKSWDGYLSERENGREYGMLNFGDWWGERRYNWGNIEYDTQHMFFLQYIRTGDRRFFFPGEWAARHNMDVDTVHYGALSDVGGAYAHCMGHVGNYDWVGPTAISRGGFSVSHTWVEGLLDYYFLTGDKRSLETAKKIADRYDIYSTRNYDFGNCRTAGWHLILTMAMYNATNDRFYLNAGKIIVDRVLERQTPETGGWERLMVPGHCHCEPPRHEGNAGFMVGILLAGLKNYYQATGDEAIAQSIIKGAEYLINDVWEPDINGFRYTSCPHSSKGTGNLRKLLGIAYSYRLTGDEKFGKVARRGSEAGIRALSGGGKGLSAHARFAPYVLYDVQVGHEK